MDYLSTFRNESDIEDVLLDLESQNEKSKDTEARMDYVHNRILKEIRSQPHRFQRIAFRTLSWLCGAARTLKTRELLEAVSVDPQHPEKWKEVKFEVSDLLDYCKGLAVVDEKTGDVRILHYSAPNYLERHNILLAEGVGPVYRAHTCLAYFRINAIQIVVMKEWNEPGIMKGYYGLAWEPEYESPGAPFSIYAAEYLEQHLLIPDQYDTLDACLSFLRCSKAREAYSYSYLWKIRYGMGNEGVQPPPNLIQLAAYFGRHLAVRKILDTDPEVDISSALEPSRTLSNRTTAYFNPATALIWGVRKKHDGVVETLLRRKDLDVNVQASFSSSMFYRKTTALNEAILSRHKTGVRLLLAREGIDLSSPVIHEDQSEPIFILYQAISYSSPDIIRLVSPHVILPAHALGYMLYKLLTRDELHHATDIPLSLLSYKDVDFSGACPSFVRANGTAATAIACAIDRNRNCNVVKAIIEHPSLSFEINVKISTGNKDGYNHGQQYSPILRGFRHLYVYKEIKYADEDVATESEFDTEEDARRRFIANAEENIKLLLGHKDIDLDFKEVDDIGRNILDLAREFGSEELKRMMEEKYREWCSKAAVTIEDGKEEGVEGSANMENAHDEINKRTEVKDEDKDIEESGDDGNDEIHGVHVQVDKADHNGGNDGNDGNNGISTTQIPITDISLNPTKKKPLVEVASKPLQLLRTGTF